MLGGPSFGRSLLSDIRKCYTRIFFKYISAHIYSVSKALSTCKSSSVLLCHDKQWTQEKIKEQFLQMKRYEMVKIKKFWKNMHIVVGNLKNKQLKEKIF